MKKLFILAMIVLGTSLAQAQDLPTLELTLFNGSSKALVVGHTINNRCVNVKTAVNGNNAISDVGVTLTYTYDNATGIVQRNGITTETATVAGRKAQLRAVFGGTFNNLYNFSNSSFTRLAVLSDSN